jgi:hypothetical protein
MAVKLGGAHPVSRGCEVARRRQRRGAAEELSGGGAQAQRGEEKGGERCSEDRVGISLL